MMKTTLGALAIVLLGSAGMAGAHEGGEGRQASEVRHQNYQGRDDNRKSAGGSVRGLDASATPNAAPEINPASALAALTLLAGGLIVMRGRRDSGLKA